MNSFASLLEKDLQGKKIVVRLDLESKVSGGLVQPNTKFLQHKETISTLTKKGASVILLASQGVAGKPDCISLKEHASILSKFLHKKVKFVDDVLGSKSLKSIKTLGKGKILMLENLSFLAEETLSENQLESLLVKRLSSECAYYVNDSLYSSGMPLTSVQALPKVLEAFPGAVLERELAAGKTVAESHGTETYFLLGGSNVKEDMKLAFHAVERNACVLTGGVFGELLSIAKGVELGQKTAWLKQFDSDLVQAKLLVEKYSERVYAPFDFAVEDGEGFRVEASAEDLARYGLCFDVGTKTSTAYADALKSASTIFFKGAFGSIEKTAFQLGTLSLLKAMQSTNAFTVVTGGSVLDLMERQGVSWKKFGFASNAGSAFSKIVLGEKLPGIEALG